MKIFIVFFFVFFLNGCSSEVDKCVDSLVKARNKYDVAAMQSGAISKIENGKEIRLQSPEEFERDSRIYCLQIIQSIDLFSRWYASQTALTSCDSTAAALPQRARTPSARHGQPAALPGRLQEHDSYLYSESLPVQFRTPQEKKTLKKSLCGSDQRDSSTQEPAY